MVFLQPFLELHTMKLTKRFRNFKKWALVTGAASGMGRIYVSRLAGMGYNVVAVDINAAGLEETAAIVRGQIASAEGLTDSQKESFRILQVVQDLSLDTAADSIFARTEEEGCEIEVLVNNAGIMYCQAIHATSERMLSLIMMVHMYTPLMICRKYLNGMRERGCGYILNISSLASWMIWPGIGMYGSTKRFVRDYSRELRIEAQKTGVSITNAYFGAVDTPLIPLKDSLRKLARFLRVMISPEKAVDKALNATFRRRKGVMPGLLNKIFKPVCVIMPDCLLGWIYRKAAPYLMKV
jgi:short-subunit dehydrogenase